MLHKFGKFGVGGGWLVGGVAHNVLFIGVNNSKSNIELPRTFTGLCKKGRKEKDRQNPYFFSDAEYYFFNLTLLQEYQLGMKVVTVLCYK